MPREEQNSCVLACIYEHKIDSVSQKLGLLSEINYIVLIADLRTMNLRFRYVKADIGNQNLLNALDVLQVMFDFREY